MPAHTSSRCSAPCEALFAAAGRLTAASLALVTASLPGCGSSSTQDPAGENGAGGSHSTFVTGAGGASLTAGTTGAGGSWTTGGSGALPSGGTSNSGGSTGTAPGPTSGGAPDATGGNRGSGGVSTAATGGTGASSGGGANIGGGKATGGSATTGNTGGAGGTTKAGSGGTAIGGTGKASGGNEGTGGTKSNDSTSAQMTGGSATGGTRPVAAPASVYNGIQWADTSGKPIQAHGGGMIKVDGYYYWFGENRNPNGTFYAVSCYRSADLAHWEFRNDVLTQNSSSDLKPANIERPKVIYNADKKKFVMWMHWENGSDYSASRAAVASCDTVDGDYTYHGSARPLVNSGVVDHGTPGYQSRDCTAFVDTDGKGYFLSATNENYDLNLYLLKSDYLSIDSLAATLFKGGHREAPALWKRNGVYFLLTSGATGWDPNQAQYATSSSLTSGWSSLANVGDSSTFHSQSTFVVPVEGSSGTAFLYMGDRWAGSWGGPVNDSSYVWQPITFPSATTMSMSWNNTITIDTSAGSVTGATNRFKFVNASTGLAMSIAGASTANNADVVLAAQGSGAEQQWSLNYDSEGYFYITNVNSSRVLDVVSSATTDGAEIIQYDDNGGANQKWRIVDKGAGDYQLLNKNSNKVAEVPAGATSGTQLVQRTASASADSQLWQMTVAK